MRSRRQTVLIKSHSNHRAVASAKHTANETGVAEQRGMEQSREQVHKAVAALLKFVGDKEGDKLFDEDELLYLVGMHAAACCCSRVPHRVGGPFRGFSRARLRPFCHACMLTGCRRRRRRRRLRCGVADFAAVVYPIRRAGGGSQEDPAATAQ